LSTTTARYNCGLSAPADIKQLCRLNATTQIGYNNRKISTSVEYNYGPVPALYRTQPWIDYDYVSIATGDWLKADNMTIHSNLKLKGSFHGSKSQIGSIGVDKAYEAIQ